MSNKGFLKPSPTHSFIHSFIHSFMCSFIHSFMYSFIYFFSGYLASLPEKRWRRLRKVRRRKVPPLRMEKKPRKLTRSTSSVHLRSVISQTMADMLWLIIGLDPRWGNLVRGRVIGGEARNFVPWGGVSYYHRGLLLLSTPLSTSWNFVLFIAVAGCCQNILFRSCLCLSTTSSSSSSRSSLPQSGSGKREARVGFRGRV